MGLKNSYTLCYLIIRHPRRLCFLIDPFLLGRHTYSRKIPIPKFPIPKFTSPSPPSLRLRPSVRAFPFSLLDLHELLVLTNPNPNPTLAF